MLLLVVVAAYHRVAHILISLTLDGKGRQCFSRVYRGVTKSGLAAAREARVSEKGAAKLHRITKPAIRRLARRASPG